MKTKILRRKYDPNKKSEVENQHGDGNHIENYLIIYVFGILHVLPLLERRLEAKCTTLIAVLLHFHFPIF